MKDAIKVLQIELNMKILFPCFCFLNPRKYNYVTMNITCSNVNFHGSAILRGGLLKEGYIESCCLPGCLIGDRGAPQSLLTAVWVYNAWDGLGLIKSCGMKWFLIRMDDVMMTSAEKKRKSAKIGCFVIWLYFWFKVNMTKLSN